MNTPIMSTPTGEDKKSAILIIHGIGQQPRYETLLFLTRGLYDHLRKRGLNPSIFMVKPAELPGGGLNRGLRIHMDKPDKASATVDIFEYYWGPYTQGIMSLPRTIKWFFARTFPRPEQLVAFPPIKMVIDALIFLLYLALIIALLVISARAALRIAGNFPGSPALSISTIIELMSWVFAAGVSFWIKLAILAYSLWQVLLRMLAILMRVFCDRKQPLQIRDEYAEERALPDGNVPNCTKVCLGNLLWLLLWLFVFLAMLSQMDAASDFNLLQIVLTLSAFLGFREFLKAFLVHFVGDIPAYLSRDEYSPSYSARRKILDTGSDLLLELLGVDPKDGPSIGIKVRRNPLVYEENRIPKRPRYDQVIVVGHSLGSVIGLDILRQTYLRISGDNRWEALTHFLTIGSPLRKISYLTLQEEGDPDRNRLNTFIMTLKPVFRVKPSRDVEPSGAALRGGSEQADAKSSNQIRWWNFVIPTDPVADYLETARAYGSIVKDITIPRIWEPILSHLRYWREPMFYDFLCDALGL